MAETSARHRLIWTRQPDGAQTAIGTKGGYIITPDGARHYLVDVEIEGISSNIARAGSESEAKAAAESFDIMVEGD